MSVSNVGVGTTAFGAGVAALTLATVNASTVTGDLIVALYLHKPETTGISAATPTGWTYAGRTTGGAGTFGTDTGPVQVGLMWKVSDGTEVANGLSFPGMADATANDSGGVLVTTYRGTLGAWATPAFVGGADSVQDTSWSVTASSTLDLATDDYLIDCAYSNTDLSGIAALTTGASGATLGAGTSRFNSTIATGNDSAVRVFDMPVTAGASGCTMTCTATLTASHAGVAMFVRVRDQVSATQGTWTYSKLATIG